MECRLVSKRVSNPFKADGAKENESERIQTGRFGFFVRFINDFRQCQKVMKFLKNTPLFGFTLLVALSCKNDYNEIPVKQENGEVWLSGGLYYCAQQIRLDNGETLVVTLEDVISFRSGDKINVRFKEIGRNKNCPEYIDSEVIEILKLDDNE